MLGYDSTLPHFRDECVAVNKVNEVGTAHGLHWYHSWILMVTATHAMSL